MPHPIPRYIPAGSLASMPITHPWDDWDPYPLIAPVDPDLVQRLGQVSDFAKLTFAIGCAEWVAARFGRHVDDRPWLFIDACWAYELSPDFAVPEELDDDEWQGQILGPICLALTTILNTRYGFDEDNAEVDAAFAERVVLHVLPDSAAFAAWRERVLLRLSQVAAVDAAPRPGRRLPRVVLDPAVPLDTSTVMPSPEISLGELELANNPFVRRIHQQRS